MCVVAVHFYAQLFPHNIRIIDKGAKWGCGSVDVFIVEFV